MRHHDVSSIVKLAVFCTLFTTMSCREESDGILDFCSNDAAAYSDAKSSLQGQFKAIWTAMNCNYPIWDYEELHGLDWDEVYKKYLPVFLDLDKKYNSTDTVPDSIIYNLYKDIFAPLHDGHLILYLENIHTGKIIKNYIFPQLDRHDTDLFIWPSPEYYSDDLVESMSGFDYLFYQYWRFKDGIVYLYLPEFRLGENFEMKDYSTYSTNVFNLWKNWFQSIQLLHDENSLRGIIIDVRDNKGGSSGDYPYTLGALHKGDIKLNGKAGHHIGYVRIKTGVGRLDFSSICPFALPVFSEEHPNVTCPIVVLANSNSASMAEITCLSAKLLKNGHVIGTPTHGGFSGSLNEDEYYKTYAGSVGDPQLQYYYNNQSYFAPFYIKIPSCAFLSMEKKIIEGNGVEPDETVHYDLSLRLSTGQDNQIDAALDYIRTCSNK